MKISIKLNYDALLIISIVFFFSLLHTNFSNATNNQEVILHPSEGVVDSYDFFGDKMLLNQNRLAVVANALDANEVGAVIYFEYENSTWSEKQQILPVGDNTFIEFGHSIAWHDDLMLVGAHSLYSEQQNNAVYIYRYDQEFWQLEQKITEFSVNQSRFGSSVTVEQDVMVFAAEDCEFSFNTDDCVVEFHFDGTSWIEHQILEPKLEFADDEFGSQLLLKDGELYVGVDRARNNNVSHAGAVFHYKRSIDGWQLAQKIVASDGMDYDEFSDVILVENNRMFISAHGHDLPVQDRGAVYVFERAGTGQLWQETAKLQPIQNPDTRFFGHSIDYANGQLLVGVGPIFPSEFINDEAYLFDQSTNGHWTSSVLINPAAGRMGRFAHSVGIDGSHLVISEPSAGIQSTGVLHSYQLDQSDWQYEGEVKALSGVENILFGTDVAQDQQNLFISAPSEFNAEDQFGAIHVYQKTTSQHVSISKIISPDPDSTSSFGLTIDADAGHLSVGSPYDEQMGNLSGAVFMYNQADGWLSHQKLTPLNTDTNSRFGLSLSLDHDFLAVGAPYEQVGAVDFVGDVSMFEKTQDGWLRIQTIQPENIITNDRFGIQVELNGNHLMVGSRHNDDIGFGTGEVDIYFKDGPTWEHMQRFTDTDNNYEDIGQQIVINGSMAAISATSELADSGAVFLLEYNGVDWQYVQVIFADDFHSQNMFGSDLAIQDQSIYIGAQGDNQFGFYAGAVYQFRRIKDQWSQVQKIHADNQLNLIKFGTSITTTSNEICVGAPWDIQRGWQSGSVYCQPKDLIFIDTFDGSKDF